MKLIILHSSSGPGLTVLMHKVHFLHSPLDVIVLGIDSPSPTQPPKRSLEEVLKLHSKKINIEFEPFEVEMGPELSGPCYNEFMARHYRGLGAGRKFIPKEKNYLCRKK